MNREKRSGLMKGCDNGRHQRLPYGRTGYTSGTMQTAPWFFVFSVREEEEKEKEIRKDPCMREYKETHHL